MNNIYVLTKEGVYGHGIQAVLTDKTNAVEWACDIAKRENDDYHTICVHEIEPDKLYFPKPTDEKEDVGILVGYARKGCSWVNMQ